MINKYLKLVLLTLFLFQFAGYAQDENDEPLLGLPGDDLDLYAVLDLFQNSKTIEAFETSLNDEKTGVNNLDLNNDGKVDFIKVVTEQDGDDFLFILQDPISEKETQDVAVIAVSKDEAGKVYMQIIGDEALYGKDYIVEPATDVQAAATANPGYVGEDPVTVNVEATTEVVVVESTPVVQYVYSTTYVPYYTPYYYGYYPHWWRPVAVVSIGIYRRNHWHHHHHHYHRGRGSVHVHHHNHYNNYNRNKRNTSNTVNNNIKNGNFKTAGQTGSRPSTSQGNRAGNSAGASNRASTSNRSAASNNKATTNNRASNSSQNKSSSANRSSNYNRSSSSSQRSSASRSMNSSNRSSGASRSGGGRSMGGGRRR